LDGVFQVLDQPRTQTELGQALSKSLGYRLKFKLGGGWGSRRKVPWLEVGNRSLPAGYLLHLAGARGALCSGPNKGNESTFIRADKWIRDWKDIQPERAEKELLYKYLRAFGPATIVDFALWTGMLVSDAKEIWSQHESEFVQVDVEGWKAAVLQSDLDDLEKADTNGSVVRLLPYFDSFILGHKSHRNIVDGTNHRRVYRPQGWVSPVLLVNGRARGVWSFARNINGVKVSVTPFSRLSNLVSSRIRQEASDLGRFFESPNVKTVIS
jgi:hypothetical protein